jgi:DNA-binding transcriptional LysR family regulator
MPATVQKSALVLFKRIYAKLIEALTSSCPGQGDGVSFIDQEVTAASAKSRFDPCDENATINAMNLHHLELFYYVAKHRGIAAAVAQMPYGIQQPGLSAQVIRLEKSLGKTLFARRPFALTPDGEELYRSIAPFFDGLDQLEVRMKDKGAQFLSITAPPTLLRDHLPKVVAEIQQRFPKLRLRIREANPTEAISLLFTEQIDVAVSLQLEKPPRDLISQALASLPMVLLVRAKSPWRKAAQVFEEVRRNAVMLVSLSHRETITQTFLQELQSRGLDWPPGIEVNSLQLIQSYVSMGFGVGLSVRVPGQPFPPGIRALPLPEFPLLEVGAFWRNPLSPPAKLFVEILHRYVKKLTHSPTKEG